MLVQTNSLSKFYSHKDGVVKAIKDIDIGIDEGDFVTIKGPSGSGKTTLLLLLGGLIRPTSGSINFKDYELHTASDNELARIRSKHIGFVMQNFSLIPYLSSLNNVMIPLSLNQNRNKAQNDYAIQLLENIGMKDRMHHLPKELSAGQQQRVAIARALVNRPNLILADEPTGNLDPGLSVEVLEFLQKINVENKITVIMATHSPIATEFGNVKIHIADGIVMN